MLTRSPPLCGPCSRVRQCVTPFVVRLAGVSKNVYPRHCMAANQLIELLPKILVYDGPTGGVTPLCRLVNYAESLLQMPEEAGIPRFEIRHSPVLP
jgi:hypothetical protein